MLAHVLLQVVFDCGIRAVELAQSIATMFFYLLAAWHSSLLLLPPRTRQHPPLWTRWLRLVLLPPPTRQQPPLGR